MIHFNIDLVSRARGVKVYVPIVNEEIALEKEVGRRLFYSESTESDGYWLFRQVHRQWTLSKIQDGCEDAQTFKYDFARRCLVSSRDNTLYRDHWVEMVFPDEDTEEKINYEENVVHRAGLV